MSEEIGYAWLACAIDGEGTIRFDIVCKTPSIQVGNNDKDFCLRCAEVTGKGTVRAQYITWRWYVCNWKDVGMVLERVLPYLIIKREVAELMLRVAKIHKLYKYSDEELQLLERVQILQHRKGDKGVIG